MIKETVLCSCNRLELKAQDGKYSLTDVVDKGLRKENLKDNMCNLEAMLSDKEFSLYKEHKRSG